MFADVGNINGMYDGIKPAIGLTQNKTAPLQAATGEVRTDRAKQMEHSLLQREYCQQGRTERHSALTDFKHLQKRFTQSRSADSDSRFIVDMVFSLRQLQDVEQRTPLNIAFIKLTRAFDLSAETASSRFWQRFAALTQS